MTENLFKVGVSDWKLEFENNQIVDIVTIVKDVVTSNSDGTTEIILSNTCFNIDVLELFRNKVKLVSLTQWFRLIDSLGKIQKECEFGYIVKEVKSVSYVGEVDGVSLLTITINGV